MSRYRSTLYLATLLAAAATAATDATPPASARTVEAVDDAFGLHLTDPYRWMEGEDNPEFASWLKGQGTWGRQQLDAGPRLAYWQTQLAGVAHAGVVNRLQQPRGARIFFLRLTAGREGVLMLRDADGIERVVLDPAAHRAAVQSAGITGFSASPDGSVVAVNVQHGGGEITDIQVLHSNGVAAPSDVIADVWGEFQANWLPDGTGFTYTQMAPRAERESSDPMLNMRVRLHRLGSDPAADPVLVASGLNPTVKLDPHEFPLLDAGAGSDMALLIIGGARPEARVCVAPRATALRPGASWHCLIGYSDNVQQTALYGRRLYFASMKDHPNGQLLSRELNARGVGGKTEVVLSEDAAAVITALAPASDGLYVKRMQGGPDEVLRVSYGAGAPQAITLPYRGAIYLFNSDRLAAGVLFTLQGWTQPRSALRATAASAVPVDLKLGEEAPGDYSNIEADEVTARSADGTEVPLTIIHRRAAQPPPNEIAILEGYGAYGIPEAPYFDPFALEWVRAGHVYAIAHVRGGGEKGDRWRLAGSGVAKERGVEDFVACAAAVRERGWASRIVAYGASMGGILVGGAITRQPEDFAAAVIQAGELNPSRLAAAKNGANQFAEVGDPHTSQGLHQLAAMDPYQRIKPGTAYPAVLLVVGLNDNRVAPWASGKFGARLAAASSSGRPVWFRTNDDMGHFNTAQSAQAREMADIFSFAERAASPDTAQSF